MQDNRGITLIELVVAIAILSAILLSIYSFYIVGVKGFTRETTTASNQMSVRRVSNEIARQIRRGKSVETVWDGKETSERIKITYPEGETAIYKLNTSNNTIEYKNDKTWLQLAERIDTFTVTSDGNQIIVSIESIENTEGYSDKLETVITKRQAKGE